MPIVSYAEGGEKREKVTGGGGLTVTGDGRTISKAGTGRRLLTSGGAERPAEDEPAKRATTVNLRSLRKGKIRGLETRREGIPTLPNPGGMGRNLAEYDART